MRKQTIQHTSPTDALIAVTKRLSTYENQQQMDSEEFFDQYSRGQLSETQYSSPGLMTTATTYNSVRN